MRSGACTLQQTLTAEAASVLKHSLGLARRRGHAHVTPLHVATTLLSLRASPLRRACLQSQQPQPQPQLQQQQPLHCRALELCINVALNRLPTTPGPLLHSQPSLSNALIAALKRAQAHQRRGCIEQQQQQPLLTIKVELEQLIISILDDPSVSRVMREAGFSSTAIKTNLEDSSSGASSVFQCYNNSGGGVFSSPCSPSPTENHRESIINGALRNAHFLASYGSEYAAPVLFSPPQKKASSVYPITDSGSSSKEDDIKVVLDVLLSKKKKNTVIVGDSVSLTEGLVGELMGKIEKGDVPDEFKSIHFIKFQFSPVSMRLMKRDEVEMNISSLKKKIESFASEGAIFYVGDLKWTVVESKRDDGEVSGYNPIEHLVAEMGKMFGEDGNCNNNNKNNNNKVWLMGTASYQTYMRCQMRQPSLETLWALQAVPVPSAGLGLTLHASSVYDSKMSMLQIPSHILDTKLFKEEHDKLNCCEECASNYEKEAQLFKPGGQKKLLPSWLQSSTEAHQKDELAQLKRKWNRLCHFLHQPQNQNHGFNTSLHTSNAKIYPYNSSYPWWPNQSNVFFPDSSSISFDDSAARPAHSSNLVPQFRRQQSCTIEFNFTEVTQKNQGTDATTATNLDSLKGLEGNKEVMITLALGNSSFGGSGKTVENIITDTTMRRAHVCKMLQENVPWQSETLSSMADALVDSKLEKKCSTWFLLQGNDSVGKSRLALAIAESVFGSVNFLLHLDMKKMESSSAPFSEIVAGSLKRNEKIVVLVEDVDFADTQFKKLLADEFEASKFVKLSKKDGNSGQAIFILTNGGRRSNEEHNNNDSVMRLVLKVSENKANFESSSPCLGHKRRAKLDLFGKIKIPRIEENEEIVFFSEQWSNKKKDFSRQSSFNTLDLNMKADEEEEEEEYDDGENSPISSDLTGEPIADNMNSNGFLDSIENRFEFNISPGRDKEKEDMFFSKIKSSFEDAFGMQKNHVNFTVDERVIEEIGIGCGYFTNSMFEKWLKVIFQTSLLKQKFNKFDDDDGKEGIVFITLCWGGKGDNRKKDSGGFMGSCLPNNIQVNYLMD